MIKIRKNVFETNSSSTHCLTIQDSLNLTPEQEEKLKNLTYVIEPFDGSYTNTYTAKKDDIKGKLTYLWTLYLENNGDGTDEAFRVIQSAVPNVIFRIIPRSSKYILEDGGYLFDKKWDGESEIQPWIKNPELLKAFLVNGEVHEWDRDYEEINDINKYLKYNALEHIEWTG